MISAAVARIEYFFSGFVFSFLKDFITFADVFRIKGNETCGNSSVGRASASQAEGHEFEPRLPLLMESQIVIVRLLSDFCFRGRLHSSVS